MPSTFLTLTNQLLRRLNEVEIAQADFASVRGVQALAKDAINASIAEINNQQFEWSFNYTTGSQLLTVGTNLYDFPSDLKKVDWNSFRIQKDDTLGTNTKHLVFISKDQWEDWFKDKDLDASTDGVNIPLNVFKGDGFQFGVTPSPEQAYTVLFDYYLNFTDLSVYSDTPTIPSNYDTVIIQGAIWHFWNFKDDDTKAAKADEKFRKLLSGMIPVLGNLPEDRMQSTMLPNTGGWWAIPTFTGASGD